MPQTLFFNSVGKIRQCGYPFLVCRCGQNPFVTRNDPERVQSLVVITTAQQGALPSVPQSRRWTRRRVPRLASVRRQLDQKVRTTSSGFWRTTDASTRESSNQAISLTSWCSPGAAPAAAPQGQPYKPTGAPLVQWLGANWAFSQPSRPWRQVFECSGANSKSGHRCSETNVRMIKIQSSQHFSQSAAAVSLKHGTPTQ